MAAPGEGPGTRGEGGPPGGLSFRGWALAVAGVHVVLGLLLFEPAPFPGGDNAGYMILGESLREGLGYRDLHLPGTPLHAKYPPLYPAVLAVLGWAGGLQLFKLASLVFTTAAVWLTARLGRRWLGEIPALAASAVVAVNPVLLEYSHFVLSEALFTLLLLLSLERAAASGSEGRLSWAAIAAAAAAFLTRTAGLPLLAAVVLYGLVRGGRRAALAALAPAAAVAGGWSLYQRLADPGGTGYLAEFAMVNPYDPSAGTVGVAGLLRRTAVNAWTYVSEVLPASLLGGGEGSVLLALAGGLAAALAAGGWIARAGERLGAAELFTVLYLALIVVWPSVWTDRRFLLPVLPVLVLYVLGGALAAGRLLRRRARGGGEGQGAVGGPAVRYGAAAALLLAIPAVAGGLSKVPDRLRCVAAYRAGSPCLPPALASFFGAADWARENTAEEALFANRKPRFFYWRGRRRGDTYRFSPEPSLVLRDMERMGAAYVVVDNLSATTPRYLIPTIERYPDRFEVAYRGGRPPTFVLRLLPSAGVGAVAPSGGESRPPANRPVDARGGRE